MYTDFSIAQIPAPSMPLTLKALWVIESDKSYNVTKRGGFEKELVLVRTIKGTGFISIEGVGDFTLEKGSLLITEHSKIRRYYCSDDCWNFSWFEFCCPADSRLPLNCLMNIDYYCNEDMLVSECLRLLRQEDGVASAIASSLFSSLMNIWLRDHITGFIHNKTYDAVLRKIAEYIRVNLDKKLNASELAKQAGLCEKRFRCVFTDLFGISPKKYMDNCRMQAAEALLTNTSMSIGEISERLGYSSQFHFAREFKKSRGIAPSKFRLS